MRGCDRWRALLAIVCVRHAPGPFTAKVACGWSLQMVSDAASEFQCRGRAAAIRRQQLADWCDPRHGIH